jgi:diaminopimelate epimerase
MKIEFTKMSGAGNDFIVLGPDYMHLLPRAPELAGKLCARRTAVGADGLILVGKTGSDIRMHYYNRDGSEAAFCGNGARCLVLYCQVMGLAQASFSFTSGSGLHTGEVTDDGVRISMDGGTIRSVTMIGVGDVTYQITFVDSGVPHAVILTRGIEKIDVDTAGRSLRNHSYFGAEGANVDFVDISSRKAFGIRTYERGVERETLACGSGCVAAAYVLREKNLAGREAAFRVASGDTLTVELPTGGEGEEVFLRGPACIVYKGTVDIKE